MLLLIVVRMIIVGKLFAKKEFVNIRNVSIYEIIAWQKRCLI